MQTPKRITALLLALITSLSLFATNVWATEEISASNTSITASKQETVQTGVERKKAPLALDVKKTRTLKMTAEGLSDKAKARSGQKAAAIKAYKTFLSKKKIHWLDIDDDYFLIKLKDCSFSLIYLDNDDIPELVVHTYAGGADGTALYSYIDGKMKLVASAHNGYSYYPKKRVFVAFRQNNGGQYSKDYYTFSNGEAKKILRLGYYIDWDTSKNPQKNGYKYKYYYEKIKGETSKEIKKNSFNKTLKKLVGSTKERTPEIYKETKDTHENTGKNRKKYLK